MFTHLKNIETAFQHIKRFSYLLIIGCTLITCFFGWNSFESVNQANNKVYVLYNGKLLEAFAADRKNNLPVELRDHIRTFHQYFFNLSPDDKAIEAGISQALYLADQSAKRQYDNLKESGYYNNLISANISQQIHVDTTELNLNSTPWTFTCYATEKLTRSSSTALRRLVTQGQIRNIQSETDNNPHGFLIENWQIIENRDTTILHQ